MKSALVHLAKGLAQAIMAHYDHTNYDRATSNLLVALSDWVKEKTETNS